MKYIVIDGYLKYHDKESGYLRSASGDIYCGAFGQLYKLEEDSDITNIVRNDDDFVTEHKIFKSGTIILITHNNDVIDITNGNQIAEYITNTVNARMQMRMKAKESDACCTQSCNN